ncbi:hypothetical protein GIB67_027534 [Kingdonia uniflora]|uniref:Uncharacterized protein n=1 Tax=Kingdonia uniflora TaxID=39325 RepID=A0A7J7NKW4_9MAGN|nr:hypothetical protein GIB67_027534 [Kingdonia uniflora]
MKYLNPDAAEIAPLFEQGRSCSNRTRLVRTECCRNERKLSLEDPVRTDKVLFEQNWSIQNLDLLEKLKNCREETQTTPGTPELHRPPPPPHKHFYKPNQGSPR